MPQDHTLNLDADLVFGGLWEGAPVIVGEDVRATVIGGLEDSSPYIVSWYCRESVRFVIRPGRLSDTRLVLPGHRGSALHVLTEAIKERVGVDSRGKVRAPASGATWRTTASLADVCVSGDAPSIMQASAILVMTDALAAELGWPTGRGAPVWSWTEGCMGDKRWWRLSARASSTESWIHEFASDLTDPMAALADVWRARGGDRSLRK